MTHNSPENTGQIDFLDFMRVCVFAGVFTRVLYFLTLPIVENDGVSLISSALATRAGGGISQILTLPSLILAGLFSVFGDGLAVASLPNLAADLGTLALIVAIGRRWASETVGWVAAALYATAPLSLGFSAIPKPYALMTFFITASLYTINRATAEVSASPAGWGVLAGASLGAGFACHTFAIFPAFLLPGLLISGVIGRQRGRIAASLAAGAVAGTIVGGLVAWRFPQFGWSVFNDFPMDWRFALARSVWSQRWEGLTNLYALAPFTLAPGLGLGAARIRVRRLDAFGWLLIGMGTLGAAMYLFNPVNHFPRVILPALPALALLSARGWLGEGAPEPRRIAVAAFTSVLGAAWLVTEFFAGRALGVGMLHDASPAVFAATTLVLAVAAAYGARAFPTDRARRFETAATGLWVAGAVVFAVVHSQQTLARQAGYGQGRLEGLIGCARASDTVGGGDLAHVILPGDNNHSWLIDLPPETLRDAFDTSLVDALGRIGARCLVYDWGDPEAEQAMLDAFAEEQGIPNERRRHLTAEADRDPRIRPLREAGSVSTYALPGYEPEGVDLSSRLKAYRPLIPSNLWRPPARAMPPELATTPQTP